MKLGILENGRELEISALDYVTKKVQILAKTDSGKTYTASKICEEMLKENQPIVIVDPVSAYWGLKEKFAIVIFADSRNKHADYQLKDDQQTINTQAELIADFLATNPASAIIDLKYWVESKQQKFMAAFAQRLYLKNKVPRHVFIEEADIFIPQTSFYPDEIDSRHHTDNLVRRGRQEGLGCTIISQRPALVSKNVLTQSDLSIYLHLGGRADLAPCKQELDDDAELSKELRQEIISRIKELPRGHAYFYSPRWLGLKSFVTVGKKETYHAGATRGSADWRPDEAITLVSVQIEELKAKLLALSTEEYETVTVKERVKDTSPAIQEYKAKLAKKDEEITSWKQHIQEDSQTIKDLQGQVETLQANEEIVENLRKLLAPKDYQPNGKTEAIIDSEQVGVTVVKKQVTNPNLDESTMIGRLAILAAEGFFNEAKSVNAIHAEMENRYADIPTYNSFRHINSDFSSAIKKLINRPYGYIEKQDTQYVITEAGKKYLRLKLVEAA